MLQFDSYFTFLFFSLLNSDLVMLVFLISLTYQKFVLPKSESIKEVGNYIVMIST